MIKQKSVIFWNLSLEILIFKSDATEKAKEQDKKMKERIYKDHLAELSGQDLFKMAKKSAYGLDFGNFYLLMLH